jgi:hypothetical protein
VDPQANLELLKTSLDYVDNLVAHFLNHKLLSEDPSRATAILAYLNREHQENLIPQLPLTDKEEELLKSLISKNYHPSMPEILSSSSESLGLDYDNISSLNKAILNSGAVRGYIEDLRTTQMAKGRQLVPMFPFIASLKKGTKKEQATVRIESSNFDLYEIAKNKLDIKGL